MEVTVNKYLNVRVGSPSLNAPCYQYLAPGSKLAVEDQLYDGDIYNGSNKWLRDLANNYYWAGGVEKSSSPILKDIDSKVSFDWFKEMQIETIWHTYQEKGEQVTVAVLDSGIDVNNKDLINAASWVGVNYPNSSACNQINDLFGHGTRCGSIVGAKNSGQYNIGIAPEAKMLVGKISCKGELTIKDTVLEGIKWAVEKGAEVISISYYFTFTDDVEKEAFRSKLQAIIKDKKVLLFACAGNNSNVDNAPYLMDYYPASFKEFVSVGATDKGKFSNKTVQSASTVIHAPGINIGAYDLSGKRSVQSGTSFSTPIVAGIAALAVSYSKKHTGSWDPVDLLNKMYASATPLGLGNKKLINPVQFFETLRS